MTRILGLARSGIGRAIGDNTTSRVRQRCDASCPQSEPWQKRGVDGPLLCDAEGHAMNAIIYLVGLVVIVMAILSFVGIR